MTRKTRSELIGMHQELLRVKLHDAYSTAAFYHATSIHLMELRDKYVFATSEFAHLPAYSKNWLRGYDSALWHKYYDNLEWRIYWRGSLVRSEDILPGTWNECDGDKSAHVYRDAPNKVF